MTGLTVANLGDLGDSASTANACRFTVSSAHDVIEIGSEGILPARTDDERRIARGEQRCWRPFDELGELNNTCFS